MKSIIQAVIADVNDETTELIVPYLQFLIRVKQHSVKIAALSASAYLRQFREAGMLDVIINSGILSVEDAVSEMVGRLAVHPFNLAVVSGELSLLKHCASIGMHAIAVGSTAKSNDSRIEHVEKLEHIDVDALCEFGVIKILPADTWKIVEDRLDPANAATWESIFALSNGVFGIRGNYDFFARDVAGISDPQTLMHGVCEFKGPHNTKRGFPGRYHAIVNWGDFFRQDIAVGGECLGLSQGIVSDFRRVLDMYKGVVTTVFVWESPSGKRLKVETVRLVSMDRLDAAAMRMQLTALNFCNTVTVHSHMQLDRRFKLFFGPAFEIIEHGVDEGAGYFHCRTLESNFSVGIAGNHAHSGGDDITLSFEQNETALATTFAIEAVKGKCISIDKHVSIVSSLRAAGREPAAAGDSVRRAMLDGFDRLYAGQQQFWHDFWQRNDIILDGPVEDQQALRFALFHLRQSHPRDDRVSISATGLTGDNYQCHVLWDTEIYMLPFFVYSDPALARQLLVYRHSLLDKARAWAREYGGRGGENLRFEN
ncbi:MAG: hypothetical protein GF398_02970 [Chitinivibrionales bacterium]|nr:hypothetical protein [Chitinivibrionales bacterium]